MNYIHVDIPCDGEECEGLITFLVSPYIPAWTYGPPENCCPDEGGDIEGWDDNCKKCGREVDSAFIEENMSEIFRKAEEEDERY